MFKLFVIFLVVTGIYCWENTTILNSFINQTGLSNLYDFSAQIYQNDTVKILLIFGGYTILQNNQKVYKNNIFKIDLSNSEYPAYQVGLSSIQLPTPRFESTSSVISDGFYIHAGQLQNGVFSDEFWMYNITSDSWKLLGKIVPFQKCNILKLNESTIIIIGFLNNPFKFLLIEYYISSNTFSIFNLSLFNAVQREVKLWDGTIQKAYLKVQQMKDQTPQNFTYIISQKFSLNIFQICSIIVNGQILTITNIGKLSVYKNGSEYFLYFNSKYSSKKNEQLFCYSQDQYALLFLGQIKNSSSSTFTLVINFKNSLTSINQNINYLTNNFQSEWIPQFTDFNIIIDNSTSIYVIVSDTLQVYVQKKNCSDQIDSYQNIQSCEFGNYICKPGYIGKFCENKECPGSLSIIDKNNILFTVIQCSGKGKCTQNGCICDQYWGGVDCSIYQRTKCHGDLIQNFPAANCECLNNPYAGGNYCQTVFCYNDCTLHGTCNSQGVCQCQIGYTGADCSIFKINFEYV